MLLLNLDMFTPSVMVQITDLFDKSNDLSGFALTLTFILFFLMFHMLHY